MPAMFEVALAAVLGIDPTMANVIEINDYSPGVQLKCKVYIVPGTNVTALRQKINSCAILLTQELHRQGMRLATVVYISVEVSNTKAVSFSSDSQHVIYIGVIACSSLLVGSSALTSSVWINLNSKIFGSLT